MPLYEYRCENCGDVFEVMQKFTDQELTVHEKCGGRVHRLLSAPALQFKGSGWYVTDYSKNSGSASTAGSESNNGGSSSSDAKKDSGSTGSTDTKPASSSSSTPASSSDKKS